jgi:predicted transglutaminase-like cysteine proteinase
VTAAPAGYVALCERDPSQCPAGRNFQAGGLIAASFEVPQSSLPLTAANWNELNTVNTKVNTVVRYVSDMDQFGQPDVWVPATREGDCEDFALEKRQLLRQAGWPVGDLSLALVESPRTGPHAVLVASTARGAYVLDNTVGWVLPWSETDYTWITAQDENGQWRVAGTNAQAVLMAAAVTARRFGAPVYADMRRNVAATIGSVAGAGAPQQPMKIASGPVAGFVSGRQVPDIGAMEPGSR